MIIHWWELLTIVLGSGIVASFLVFFLVSRYISARTKPIRDFINDYFIPPDNDNPSKFGLTIDAVGKSVAGNLLGSLKAAEMGAASGEAKREAALEQAMAQDQLGSMNPILGMVASSYPSVAKILGKNPAALRTLANMAQSGRLGNFGLKQRGGGNGQDDFNTNLARYNK